MRVPYVYEEIEVIIEFYEALYAESTPSREREICECAVKGLTKANRRSLLCGYWSVGLSSGVMAGILCHGRGFVS